MTNAQNNELSPGDMVVLTEIPLGLLDGLPPEDKEAISKIVDKPILLNEYDADGRAELKFTDSNGVIHFIYVKTSFIRAAK